MNGAVHVLYIGSHGVFQLIYHLFHLIGVARTERLRGIHQLEVFLHLKFEVFLHFLLLVL
jgi:hypothetical protein